MTITVKRLAKTPVKISARILLSCVFLLFAFSAHAGESIFGYVYTTDMMPKHKFELEQWITGREGQAHGFFHHFDMSTELEYGVTTNFQVGFYVNYNYFDEYHNSVLYKTEGIEIPWYHDRNARYHAGHFDGVSLELMYRVLNPYLDPIGLSFYIEPEFDAYEQGVEYRAIAQKNYLDDTLVLAVNEWIEPDFEQNSNLVSPLDPTVQSTGTWSDNLYWETDLGISYRFRSQWAFGLEARNHNEFRGWTLSGSSQDHTAFFIGPNIHYAAQKWWGTLTLMRQIGVATFSPDQTAQVYHGLLYGDEHTTWDGIRLKIGIPFD